jgi:hypothetical protein
MRQRLDYSYKFIFEIEEEAKKREESNKVNEQSENT